MALTGHSATKMTGTFDPKPAAALSPADALARIDANIKRLADRYVTDPILDVNVIADLADGGIAGPFLANNQPIARITIQNFSPNTVLSVWFTNAAVNGLIVPNVQIYPGQPPFIMPIPDMPVSVSVRNDSGNTDTINACVIISTAGG